MTGGAAHRPVVGPLDMSAPLVDAVRRDGQPLDRCRGLVASLATDRMRWRCGLLVPPASVATGDRSTMHTECLLETRDDASLHVRLCCLQMQATTMQERRYGGWRDVPSLSIAGVAHTSVDEPVEREINAVFAVDSLIARPRVEDLLLPGGAEVASLPGDPEQCVGRMVRRRWPIAGRLRLAATALAGPYGMVRLRLEVSNVDEWQGGVTVSRAETLRHSLIAPRLLVAASGGRFLSLLDPPVWARPAVADCDHDGVLPVLAGDPGSSDVVLASPAVRSDYPTPAMLAACGPPGFADEPNPHHRGDRDSASDRRS